MKKWDFVLVEECFARERRQNGTSAFCKMKIPCCPKIFWQANQKTMANNWPRGLNKQELVD